MGVLRVWNGSGWDEIKGERGDTGASAYQIAVNEGFVGTEEEWLESLAVDPADIEAAVDAAIDADPRISSLDTAVTSHESRLDAAEPQISALTNMSAALAMDARDHNVAIEQFAKNIAMRPDRTAMFYDFFNRPDTSSSLRISTSGVPWVTDPTFRVVDGAPVYTSTGRGFATFHSIHKPDEIDMVFDAPESGVGFDLGPMWRRNASNDLLYLSARYAADNLRLNWFGPASHPTLATASAVGWQLGRRYRLTVRDVGNVITVYLDGVQVLTHTVTDPGLLDPARLNRVGFTINESYDSGARIVSLVTRRTATAKRRAFPLNIAHRGMTSGLPENSVVSVKHLPDNIDGVEIDVKPTADGEWVCMHDVTVDRTTNGTGTVTALDSAYVRSLLIDGGGGLVPTAKEILDAAYERGLKEVHLHVAGYDYASLMSIVDAHPMAAKCVFFGSDRGQVQGVRDLSATARIALGGVTAATAATEIPWAASRNVELVYLAPGDTAYTINRAVVTDIHAAGMKAGASTVNLAPTMEMARADGVDVMMTDYGAMVNV